MGGTATRRPAVAVASVTLAALLGGCASVGTWTPASDRGPTAAAPDAVPSPSASPPATTPKPTPTRSATPTPARTPSPSPTRSSAPAAPTPKASTRPAPSPTPTTKPRTTLVRGDSGARVLALQQRLTRLGYWLGEPDGSFGMLTEQAVLALQKSAGISRDGVVGPRTTRALEAGIRPEVTLSGDGVEIDLDRQVLVVVRDGSPEVVLNTSTGNGEEYISTKGNRALATTPKGSFTVYRAVDGPLTNSLGELWRPRFFNRGIAVHGSPNIPAWPASHGCARLSNPAIDMIWARGLMPVGSRVVVR